MFCPNCGKKLPDDAVFCYACGKNLGELKKTLEQETGDVPDSENSADGKDYANLPDYSDNVDVPIYNDNTDMSDYSDNVDVAGDNDVDMGYYDDIGQYENDGNDSYDVFQKSKKKKIITGAVVIVAIAIVAVIITLITKGVMESSIEGDWAVDLSSIKFDNAIDTVADISDTRIRNSQRDAIEKIIDKIDMKKVVKVVDCFNIRFKSNGTAVVVVQYDNLKTAAYDLAKSLYEVAVDLDEETVADLLNVSVSELDDYLYYGSWKDTCAEYYEYILDELEEEFYEDRFERFFDGTIKNGVLVSDTLLDYDYTKTELELEGVTIQISRSFNTISVTEVSGRDLSSYERRILRELQNAFEELNIKFKKVG